MKSTSSTSTQGLHTMVNCEGDPDLSASRSSRSRVVPVDWSLCLFCQKKKHKNCRELLHVRSFDACQSIRHAAEIRNDEPMLLKIHGIDVIAAEAKYHKACRSKYVSKSNLQYQERKETTQKKICILRRLRRWLLTYSRVLLLVKPMT